VRTEAGKQIDQPELNGDGNQPALVRLSLPAGLSAGTYNVAWSAMAEDLHLAKGNFSFRIAP